jgi:hypothetical protein
VLSLQRELRALAAALDGDCAEDAAEHLAAVWGGISNAAEAVLRQVDRAHSILDEDWQTKLIR